MTGRRRYQGLAARFFLAQLLVVGASVLAAVVVASLAGPPLFHEHLEQAGAGHDAAQMLHVEQAYRDANPEHLLHTRSDDGRYSRLHGWFIAGHRDRPAVDALHALSSAAERAGVDVSTATPRGGHDFGLWRDALRTTFPDVVRWGGLPQSGQ